MELCHWIIIPKYQYEAAKALRKLVKKGTWDGGQGLDLPSLPKNVYKIEEAVQEFARLHKIHNLTELREMYRLLIDSEEEMKANKAEEKRQRGEIVKYGDAIQFVHASLNSTLTVSKKQGAEKSSKTLELLHKGSENSIFVVLPAYKTFSQGEPVNSGDLICFFSERKIVGNICRLHVSQKQNKNLDSGEEEDDVVYEMDASVHDSESTSWRALLFQSSLLSGEENIVKSEDVICIYHKDGESYLNFDPQLNKAPFFHLRTKVKPIDRKKSGWLWKIEGEHIYLGGQNIECDERKRYRLKHLVTGEYLKSNGGNLEMTKSCAEGTLFSFRHFAKDASTRNVYNHSLVMIQGNGWLSMAHDESVTVSERAGKKYSGNKAITTDLGALNSERDAFILVPVPKTYEDLIKQLKSDASFLLQFRNRLELVVFVEGAGADRRGAVGGSKQGRRAVQAPAQLPHRSAHGPHLAVLVGHRHESDDARGTTSPADPEAAQRDECHQRVLGHR
eukprot:748658-Hanusia_phi.AAC.2